MDKTGRNHFRDRLELETRMEWRGKTVENKVKMSVDNSVKKSGC